MSSNELLLINIGGTKVDYVFLNKKELDLITNDKSIFNLSKKLKINSFERKKNTKLLLSLLDESKNISVAIASPVKNNDIFYKNRFSKSLINKLNKLKNKNLIIENDSNCAALSHTIFE